MKKFNLLSLALITAISIGGMAEAKKKDKGLVKAFGDTVTGSVKSNVSGNVKKGIYGKSSMEAAEEKVVKPTPTPTPPPVETLSSGMPLDPVVVKKNQMKEDHVASGILYMNKQEYSKALEEFKKAKDISSDLITQRWIDIANNKLKIVEMTSLIESMTAEFGVKDR